jgi:hypothetical protein
VEEIDTHRNIKAIFILAIEALLGGMKVSAAGTARVDVHRGVVRKEGHSGQRRGWR